MPHPRVSGRISARRGEHASEDALGASERGPIFLSSFGCCFSEPVSILRRRRTANAEMQGVAMHLYEPRPLPTWGWLSWLGPIKFRGVFAAGRRCCTTPCSVDRGRAGGEGKGGGRGYDTGGYWDSETSRPCEWPVFFSSLPTIREGRRQHLKCQEREKC